MDIHAAPTSLRTALARRLPLRHAALRLALAAAGVVAFGLATLLAAQVRLQLPISPVPITLQTLVVLLAGLLLGPRVGAASQLAFVALAITPWGSFAGPIHLTAGYVVGFVVAAAVVGRLAAGQQPYRRLLAATLLGSALILLCGAVWLASAAGLGARAALLQGVLPYLPGDAAKAALAASIAAGLRRLGDQAV